MLQPSQILRAVRANMKLGWDQEGNWTHPLLYLLFALVTPIAGVLMFVFMYRVIMGGSTDLSYLRFLLAGSSVFIYIRLVLQGAGFAVVEDREHYRVFRYIYIAPAPFPAQIIGRTAVKLVISTLGAALTLAAGVLLLKVSMNPIGIHWSALLCSLVVGLIGIMAIGWILASIMLLIDRMGWVWAEGLAGLMLLATGAVIPFRALPEYMTGIGKILPTTYWIEIWRYALYGAQTQFSLPQLSQSELWKGLLISSSIWTAVSILWYKTADYLARRWGRIERETFY